MVAVEIDGAMALPKEARGVLHKLASGWKDVADHRALDVVRLNGAMTNQVYAIKWTAKKERGTPRKVLVRIYGEGVEAFFDRSDEIRTFETMSKHGKGPQLLGRFPNGRIEEFIHAKTLTASDLREQETSALVAANLKEFHGLDMAGPKKIALWERLRYLHAKISTGNWLAFSYELLVRISKLGFTVVRAWLKAAREFASNREAEEFRLSSLEDEITTLEGKLHTTNQRIGFCHNDLQYGNIMMDEETRVVTIIDYEYASYNPIAYDIANHFCEMAADYHTETPHILNYDKYPEIEERKIFLHNYLQSSGEKLSDTEVEDLLEEIERYTLASHLLWGLWGIISEHVNEIDFDYEEYARQRFQQYWLRKPILLGT